MERVHLILWGWGHDYAWSLNLLRLMEETGQIAVEAVTASVLPPYGTLDGYPVVTPEEAKELPADYVVIMTEKYEGEAIRDCMERTGTARERIIPARVLSVPGFSFPLYRELAESRLSIVCQNCWGGFVSRTLGLKHRSPFKNLFITEEDFIRMAANLRGYLEDREPVFAGWDPGGDIGQERYPVLSLGDVRLYCNHDRDPDEAIAAWRRRAADMDHENRLTVFFTESPEMAERFLRTDMEGRRLCAVSFRTGLPGCVTLPVLPGLTWVETIMASARMTGKNTAFDLFRLLTGREPFMRCRLPGKEG